MSITDGEVKALELEATALRESVVEMLLSAGSGHTAGSLGMADVFAALYFKILRHDPKNPSWSHRDRLILSNGHICPVMYAAMAHSGYFDVKELSTLRKFKSILQGHPHREFLPALENSSGPLGSGLSQTIGMALADKIKSSKILDNNNKYFYCLMGDGEMDEGNVWEALMLLSKLKLTNIITIIDRNTIQIDGFTEDIMPLEPLPHKLETFNFNVIEINGHDMRSIVYAIDVAKTNKLKPTIIIAHTIPGKGYVKIEGDYRWHGKAPNDKEAREALHDLHTLHNRIEKH